MQKYDWLVVGGGFQGIIAASLLSKSQKNISIIERGGGLGGVLRGKDHDGMVLDFGCHLFTNDKSDVTALMLEILGDKFHPVDVRYASIVQDHKKDGVAVPSFDFLPDDQKKTVLDQILKNALARQDGDKQEYATIADWISEHYGEELSAKVMPMVKTACGHDAKDVDGDCIYKTQLACVHLSDDEEEILPLKNEHPEFDKVVALSSQKDQMRFYREAEKDFEYRTFYPAGTGTRGFADSAEEYFGRNDVDVLTGKSIKSLRKSEQGVVVQLEDGEEIEAKKLVWTLDIGFLSTLLFEENPLAPYLLNVPLSLFYYFIDKDDAPKYTYLHDFTESKKLYRVSAPGFYGQQSNEKGQSYICAEVPAKPDSDLWQNPANYSDEIWEEIKATGMVDIDEPQDSFQLSTPVSYPLMKEGYQRVYQDIADKITAEHPDIVNVNMNAYSKNDIVRVVSEILKNEELAA